MLLRIEVSRSTKWSVKELRSIKREFYKNLTSIFLAALSMMFQVLGNKMLRNIHKRIIISSLPICMLKSSLKFN